MFAIFFKSNCISLSSFYNLVYNQQRTPITFGAIFWAYAWNMRETFLARINQEKNEYRFYRLLLPPGSRALLKQWGRINDYVVEDWELIPDHESGVKLFEKILAGKQKEGYAISDWGVMPKEYRKYVRPAEYECGQLSFLP